MNVYVYEEYYDDDVFDERNVKVFLNKSNAVKELRSSVEKYFDEDWAQIGDEEMGPDDIFKTDHVSYSDDGETTHYWEIISVYTPESRYCTEDDIANEIGAMVDQFPEWDNISEAAYGELAKTVSEFIEASDEPDNLSDLIDSAVEDYMRQHPELDEIKDEFEDESEE